MTTKGADECGEDDNIRALHGLVALALVACHNDGRIPVVLYSPHGRDQLTLLEQAFEAERPDIDVRWLDMGSQEILDRVRFERVNPQADVWFGGPTTIFDLGVRDSLLQPYRPVWADRVGPNGIGPESSTGRVYRTPAVIAYNNKVVSAAEAPHDWDDVLAPRWRDKIVIRDPMASGTMRAIWGLILVRSIRETGDTAQGMAWLRRLDGATKTYTLNPAILDAKLARAEGLVTLWDLPDILIGRSKGMPFGYAFPRSGTVVIDDAIGAGARQPASGGGQGVHRLRRRRRGPAPRGGPGLPASGATRSPTGPGAGLGRGGGAEMVVAPMDWRCSRSGGPPG